MEDKYPDNILNKYKYAQSLRCDHYQVWYAILDNSSVLWVSNIPVLKETINERI